MEKPLRFDGVVGGPDGGRSSGDSLSFDVWRDAGAH